MTNKTDQTGPRYGLVLSGGGIRFATHAGVVAEMAQWTLDGRPWLDQVQVIVGTSAGALYAAHLAAGYTPGHFAALARLFAQPEFKPYLFNWNYDKAAAAFLRHDISFVRGVTNGFGVLSLFETTLSRSVRDFMLSEFPDPHVLDTDESRRRRAAKEIATRWKARRSQPHDDRYYHDPDLLTFGDLQKDLYLIGVNAYTGQKTIFCRVGSAAEGETLDRRMAAATPLHYINSEEADAALVNLSEDLHLDKPLKFKRFMGRVYRDFDPHIYSNPGQFGNNNPQLPLALAVRSSVSVPGIFEPVKIRRAPTLLKSGQPINPNPYDLFIDGGVDDNFSLSVAADKFLGRCENILGVFLGNLGYRLPEAEAASNIATILLNTTNYMGDALQDWQALDRALEGHHITIINALPSLEAQITDTEKIGQLVQEGREIAQSFWVKVHQADQYPSTTPVPIDQTRVWSTGSQQQIFLSKAALSGPKSFPNFLKGQAELPVPTVLDVVTQIPAVLLPQAARPLSKAWALVYALLLVLAYGVVTLISDVFGEPTGVSRAIRQVLGGEGPSIGWFLVRLVLAIVLVLLLRLWAYSIWARLNQRIDALDAVPAVPAPAAANPQG